MPETPLSPNPTTPPTPLVARSEQIALLVLGALVLAGIAAVAVRRLGLGREPMAVVPPADGPSYAVNVNAADWVTLALVPGLGEALSKRIVAERDDRGGRFESLDDLKNVRGINEKILDKLRPYLFLDDPDTDEEPVRMLVAD